MCDCCQSLQYYCYDRLALTDTCDVPACVYSQHIYRDVAEGGKTKEKSNLHANVLMAAAALSKGIGQNLTALQLLRNAY
jgi:hypothetical protein